MGFVKLVFDQIPLIEIAVNVILWAFSIRELAPERPNVQVRISGSWRKPENLDRYRPVLIRSECCEPRGREVNVAVIQHWKSERITAVVEN